MTPEGAGTAGFTAFVENAGHRLQRALMAALGPELGDDACSEALALGWRDWDRIRAMQNPAGYLYRVGVNKGRRLARTRPAFPAPRPRLDDGMPAVEPGLPAALESLSEKQRVCTLLVHAEDWTLTEAGNLLGIDPGSVKKHVDRGLAKLRQSLEVQVDA